MARSRSPRAPRFSRASPPVLKTWVLCRVGASKWRDAVPALVSHVAAAGEAVKKGGAGATVSVLAPNVLALQHSFGGGAYKELRGLPLQDVRPYHGTDLQRLRDALLGAFRQQARARAASLGPPADDVEEDAAGLGPQPPEAALVESAESTAQLQAYEEPARLHTRGDFTQAVRSSRAAQPAPVAEAADTPIAPQLPVPAPPPGAAQAPHEMRCLSGLALTRRVPAESGERHVAKAASGLQCREVAAPELRPPPTPEPLKCWSAGAPVTPERPVPARPARAAMAAGGAALTKQRLRELTALVAKSFQAACEPTLTREELHAAAKTVASTAELDEALDRLSASGKVFLSSDLVFLL